MRGSGDLVGGEGYGGLPRQKCPPLKYANDFAPKKSFSKPAKTEVLSLKKHPKKYVQHTLKGAKSALQPSIFMLGKIKKCPPPPMHQISLRAPTHSASLKNERTLPLQGFSILNSSYLWAKMFFVAKWVAHACAVCCSWGNNLFGNLLFASVVDVDCSDFGRSRLFSFDLNLWVPCQSWNTMGCSELIVATQNIILISLWQLWRLKKV